MSIMTSLSLSLSFVLLFLLLLSLLTSCVAQYQKFTEREKNEILQRHKQRLEQESLKLFQGQLAKDTNGQKRQSSKFQNAVNYEGVYQAMAVHNITTSVLQCGSTLSQPLMGIDYKRHHHRHYLLCYTNKVLQIQTFKVVDGTKVELDQSRLYQARIKGDLQQAILYSTWDNHKLMVAALIRRGSIFHIESFEVDGSNMKIIDTHNFAPFEEVIKIDILFYESQKYKIVALLNANNNQQSAPRLEGKIVKVRLQAAKVLKTMRIQTQGIIISGNSSDWFVYRYQESHSQLIDHYGANSQIVDLGTMSFGLRHYLAVAAEHNQMIYRWDGKHFVPSAKFSMKQVYKMNIITTSYVREDNFFYFDQMPPNRNFIGIFTFDFNQREFIRMATIAKKQFNIPKVIFDTKSFVRFSEQNMAFEMKLSNSSIHVFAYEMTTVKNDATKRKVQDGLQMQEQRIIEKKIANLKQNLHKLETKETISKKQMNLTFNFDVRFEGNVFVKRYESFDTKRPQMLTINRKALNLDEVQASLEELRKEFKSVLQWHQQVKAQLDNKVVYRTLNTNFGGSFHFVNDFAASQVHASWSTVHFYKGSSVSNILQNLYRLSAPTLIKGKKVLHSTPVIEKHLHAGLINGVDPSRFMYANLTQHVYASLWYSNVETNNLELGDKLASNLSLSKAIFINHPDGRPVVIQNRIIFDDIHVDQLHVDAIDGVSITKLANQALRKDVKKLQTFKLLTQMATLKAHTQFETENINGYTRERLFANLVRKSSPAKFAKQVRIEGDLYLRFLNAHKQVNSVNIPQDLLDRYSEQVITGVKRFKHLEVKNLQASTVNNIRIPEDIVTLSQDDPIFGKVYLDALRVDANLHVGGLIDRINLTYLDQRYIASLQNRYENLTFNKPVRVKWLKLHGLSDEVNIEHIYRDSVFNHSQSVHIPSAKTVNSILRCRSIQADMINGQNLSNFVRTNLPENLSRSVIFKQPVQFVDVNLANILDGVPINALVERVNSLKQHFIIHGEKYFDQTLHVDHLTVLGSINRILPDSFMLYSKAQNVTGDTFFKDTSVSRFNSAATLQLLSKLNNVPFEHFTANRIALDKAYSLGVQLHCFNCSASHISATYVNGKNFSYFQRNYLSKSVPQVIRASKHFKATQHFAEISTQQGVAGIDLRHIHHNVITLNGYNKIHNPIHLMGDLHLNHGRLNIKLFNEIDLESYSRFVVYTNSSLPVQIHGTLIYKNGFDLHADMYLRTLNSHPPEKLIFTNKGNHSIQSRILFTGRVITSGHLKVNVAVNNLNLTKLDENLLKVNENGELMGPVKFMHNVKVHQVKVAGLVDGIPLHRKSILTTNSQHNVNQMCIQGSARFDGNVNVWDSINDFHKDNLHRVVLLKSQQEQVINATKVFTKIEAYEIHQFKGDVHIKVVNRMPLRLFESKAIYSLVNRTMTSKLNFVHNVTISNPNGVMVNAQINKINLLTDVIRLDMPNQTITGVKIFEQLVLNDDIEVHGHVNEINLRKVANNILYNVGPQTITNGLNFKAPLYLTSPSKVGLFNGVKPENLLTTVGDDQRMNGQVHFTNVRVDYVNSRLVNNVNLTDIEQHVLVKNSERPQRVDGIVSVNKAQFNNDVHLRYHLNKVDLNVAVNKATATLSHKFDIKQVANKVIHYTNGLFQQHARTEWANFDIELLQVIPAKISMEWLASYRYRHSATNVQHAAGQILAQLEARGSRIQPFIHQSMSWIVQSDIVTGGRSLVMIKQLLQAPGQNLVQLKPVLQLDVDSNTNVLLFVMDQSVYELRAPKASSLSSRHHCVPSANRTISKLTRLEWRKLSNAWPVEQWFPEERETISLGHFVDQYNYHYLVFLADDHHNQRQIRVYKRYHPCSFELIQSLLAPNVEQIALFKFGLIDLTEQYLVTLSHTRLTLWKHQGIQGFSKKWSISMSQTKRNNLGIRSFIVWPFLDQWSLKFYTSFCNISLIEARLNGHFTNLQLVYDEYI